MDLDAIALVTTPRRLAARAPWRPDSPDPSPARCPGCGTPLRLDPAGPDDPDRLIGTCPARQCREEAVIFRRLEGRLIVAGRESRRAAPLINRQSGQF
jgi:hypothetical protein